MPESSSTNSLVLRDYPVLLSVQKIPSQTLLSIVLGIEYPDQPDVQRTKHERQINTMNWNSDVDHIRRCLEGTSGTRLQQAYQNASVRSSFLPNRIKTLSSVLLSREENAMVHTIGRIALASCSVLGRRRIREQMLLAGGSLPTPSGTPEAERVEAVVANVLSQDIAEAERVDAVVANVLSQDSAFIDAYNAAAERQRLATEEDSLYKQIAQPMSVPVSRITYQTIVSLWDLLLQCRRFDPETSHEATQKLQSAIGFNKVRERFLAAYEADAASGDQASPRSELHLTQNTDDRHASWRRIISASAVSLHGLRDSLPKDFRNKLASVGGGVFPDEDQIRTRLLLHLDSDAELRHLRPSLYPAEGRSYLLPAGEVPASTIHALHKSGLINMGFSPARADALLQALLSETGPSLEDSFRKEIVIPESYEGETGTKLEPATLAISANEELRKIPWRRMAQAAQRSLRSHRAQITSFLTTADSHEKGLGSTLPRFVVNVEGMHHKTFPMLDSDMDLFEACQKTLGESGGTTSSVGLRSSPKRPSEASST